MHSVTYFHSQNYTNHIFRQVHIHDSNAENPTEIGEGEHGSAGGEGGEHDREGDSEHDGEDGEHN